MLSNGDDRVGQLMVKCLKIGVQLPNMVVFRGDPCGLLCFVFTYAAVVYADFVVIKWIVLPTMSDSLVGPFIVITFNIVLFLLTMAHFRAVFSDPGTVPLPSNNLDFSDMHSSAVEKFNKEEWTVCSRCETYRPPRAHHCRICRRCIRRMDHHCPWINNCVGELNQKYFLQFLIYVGIASIYSIALVAMSWATDCGPCQNIDFKQQKVIHSIILVLESVLFGLFVIAIMVDQLQAILSDETPIESLQKRGPHRPKKPKMALMVEVCGKESAMFWIFPCQGPPRSLHSFENHYDV